MLPSDFEQLLRFVYGPAWRDRLADDARLRPDNLRRLVDGRRSVPPPVAEFILRRVADRWLLRGWAEERPPPGLSPPIAAELERRIVAARRAAAPAGFGDPEQPLEEQAPMTAATRDQVAGRFGRAVKAARERLNWTQEELAARSTVPIAQIKRFELGQRAPNLADAILLARPLDLSIDELG